MLGLDEAFEHLDSQHKHRSPTTPVVLLVAFIILFIIYRFFEFIGLYPLANLAFIIGTADLVLLIAYLLCIYSGRYSDVTKLIDFNSEIIWRYAMDIILKLMQNSMEDQKSTNDLSNNSETQLESTNNLSTNITSPSFSASAANRRSILIKFDPLFLEIRDSNDGNYKKDMDLL